VIKEYQEVNQLANSITLSDASASCYPLPERNGLIKKNYKFLGKTYPNEEDLQAAANENKPSNLCIL